MASSLHCAYEELIEYRPSAAAAWIPATLTTVLESHGEGASSQLIVNVVDADGATVLFSAPISSPMAAQCDAGKLDDERRVNVFDESNDHEAQLRFSSRHVGVSFVQSLVAGMFRIAGCIVPQVFVINEEAVRRNQGIENAASQVYSVHVEVQRAGLYDAWTVVPKGDLVVDANIGGSAETKGSVSVGGSPQLASVTHEEDAVQAVLLRAKEHLSFVVALDPAQLTAATVLPWLPDALRDALHADCDKICAVVVKVESMEVSDDAKKDSIKRRLQRQGAQSLGSGATPLMKPLRPVSMSISNDSFGVDRNSGGGGRASSGPQPRPTDVVVVPATTSKQDSAAAKATRREAAQQAAAVAAADEEPEPEVPPVKKKKSKKHVSSADYTTAGDVPYEEPVVVAVPPKRSKGSRSAPADVEVVEPVEAAALPLGSPVSALVDYAQLVELQVKLDKKRQRLLKFEAEVLLKLEASERAQQVNEEKMAEVVAMRNALEAERQQMTHQQQQHEATMRMLRDEEEARGGSRSRGDVGGSASKRVGARTVAIAGSPSSGKGEREPLVGQFQSSSPPTYYQNVQGPEATFSLRLDHPFYDNSSLPPSVERCYPITAVYLKAMHHIGGTVVLFAMLGTGIGLVSWSVAEHSDSCARLWPLCVLYAMACIVQLVTLRHKTALYDGLHRLDQSCSQFDHVVFLYQRSTAFLVQPLSIVAVALASLVVLLASSIPLLTQVGIILGTAGATLSFGSFSLFLMLVTSVAWDRVCATVPMDAGTLCSRLAIRRVAAHYQFVKSLVVGVSREWSIDIVVMLVVLFAVMFYCVYAAIELYSFSALLIYNAVFVWAAAFSFVVLRAVTGWQRATLATIGTIAVHCDRWARGDYNSEGDLKLEDYVALQQSMYFATQGSSYAKWSLRLLDDDATFGRVWLWVCGTLTLASLVLIPVTVLYHIDSWDA